jgi:hypothetical protein
LRGRRKLARIPRWFPCDHVFVPTNKTDRHDNTEILLTVALNTLTLTSAVNLMATIFSDYKWDKNAGFELTTLMVIDTDCIGSY